MTLIAVRSSGQVEHDGYPSRIKAYPACSISFFTFPLLCASTRSDEPPMCWRSRASQHGVVKVGGEYRHGNTSRNDGIRMNEMKPVRTNKDVRYSRLSGLLLEVILNLRAVIYIKESQLESLSFVYYGFHTSLIQPGRRLAICSSLMI